MYIDKSNKKNNNIIIGLMFIVSFINKEFGFLLMFNFCKCFWKFK